MTRLPVTFLRLRLLDQFRRAQKKGDRVAMIFLSQRLAKLT